MGQAIANKNRKTCNRQPDRSAWFRWLDLDVIIMATVDRGSPKIWEYTKFKYHPSNMNTQLTAAIQSPNQVTLDNEKNIFSIVAICRHRPRDKLGPGDIPATWPPPTRWLQRWSTQPEPQHFVNIVLFEDLPVVRLLAALLTGSWCGKTTCL